MGVRNRLRARQVIHSWPVQINVWSLENKLDDLGTRIKAEKQDRRRPLSTTSCHSASTLTLSLRVLGNVCQTLWFARVQVSRPQADTGLCSV